MNGEYSPIDSISRATKPSPGAHLPSTEVAYQVNVTRRGSI